MPIVTNDCSQPEADMNIRPDQEAELFGKQKSSGTQSPASKAKILLIVGYFLKL